MKAILISINPKHVANILNGKKTIELRKTFPHCALPIDVYIYCTKDKKYTNLINRGGFLTGMVVAKFTLKEIREAKYQPNVDEHTKLANKLTCLTDEEIDKYFGKKDGYGWVIDDLVIFDKPKEIKEFKSANKYEAFINTIRVYRVYKPLTRAPQSWCYVEV